MGKGANPMADDHLKRSASFGSTHRDEPSFEEDPLVELARIVAEDGGFYRQGRAPELRPARNEPARHAASPEELLANQLEAELMQNMDFSAERRDVPEPRPVTELRSFGGMPEGRLPHVQLRPALGDPQHQPSRFPHFVVEDARPHAAAPPGSWQDSAGPAGGSGGFAVAGLPVEAAAGRQGEPWREADDDLSEGLAESSEEDFAAPYAEMETAQQAGDRESGFEAGAAGSAETADAGYAEPYADDDDYDESDPDDWTADDADEDQAASQAARRAAVGGGRRSYKGLLAAAGVLGLVVLGGAVTLMMGSEGPTGESGPPPVIKAESEPAKVAAEGTEQAQAGDGAGQAVYDRVAGRAPKSDEKLVGRAEEPRQVSRVVLPEPGATAEEAAGTGVAGDAASDGSADRTAAAVVQQDKSPSGEEIAGQISSQTPSMQTGPRIDPVGPRRVRTVTVKPDGTIVSRPEPVRVAEASAQPAGAVERDFDLANAPEAVPVRTMTVRSEERPSGPLAGEAAAPAPENGAAPQPLVPSAESSPAQPSAAAETPAEAADAAEPAETQLAMLPRARPDEIPAAFTRPAAAPARQSQPAATQPAARSRGGQPVDLLAAGPAAPRAQAQPAAQPARPAAAASSSPFAVQVSAQRSEEQARAAIAGLRNRFPSVLQGQQAEIERADLGDRGIYYRVRIGAQSQAEANRLCEQLKAAGGSCFVTR
jgi:hypothetical protein